MSSLATREGGSRPWRAAQRATRVDLTDPYGRPLMDPDAALAELLRLADLVTVGGDAQIGARTDRRDTFRMAELVEALDSWLTAGGFLPRRWKPGSWRDA